MITTYEVRPITPEDIAKNPIGLFENGELAGRFKNEADSKDEMEFRKKTAAIRLAFNQFVETTAKQFETDDSEVLRAIYDDVLLGLLQ